MRNNPQKVTCALDLFYNGISTRKVQQHFKAFFPHNASNVSIYNWVVKYSKIMHKFTDKLKLNIGNEIQVDEVEYHRRENPNTDWYDNERTECDPMYTEIENYKNWEERFFQIVNLGVPVIHSFIPNWHTSVVDYSAMGTNVIAPELKLDIARDGFHYGSKTHQSLAEKMYKLLATQGIM